LSRLIGKSDGHNHSSIITNGESSTIAPLLPQPQIVNETTTSKNKKISKKIFYHLNLFKKVPTNETAETKMAFIVEGMLSKLIDVGTSGSNITQTNSNINGLNTQNDNLRHLLNKSLSSTKLSTLPDAGLNNLPSLLSGRPISSDICHFVAHTAGELSRLLIDEIKIVHKEDLVVVFE